MPKKKSGSATTPGATNQLTLAEIDEARRRIEHEVRRLKSALSTGNEPATWALYSVAIEATQALLETQSLEIVQSAIRESSVWPTLMFSSRHATDYVQGSVRKIGLGEYSDAPLDHRNALKSKSPIRQFAVHLHCILSAFRRAAELQKNMASLRESATKADLNPADYSERYNLWAESLKLGGRHLRDFRKLIGSKRLIDHAKIQRLADACVDLPPFGPETVRLWFDHGVSMVDPLLGAEPQKYEIVKELGQYRVGHSGDTKKAITTDYRDGFYTKLWQSFRTLSRFQVTP